MTKSTTGTQFTLPDADRLTRLLNASLPAGAIGGVRRIEDGDENHLTAVEAEAMPHAVTSVRKASGAARRLARELCSSIGLHVHDIPRRPDATPVWPVEVVGSLAHDALLAAAVIARSETFGGVGIDVEPPESLDSGVVELVASASERSQFRDVPCGDKAIFSIKEAVFKAVYPTDGLFLDFRDVMLIYESRTAMTRQGRIVHWCVFTQPWLIAAAWWTHQR